MREINESKNTNEKNDTIFYVLSSLIFAALCVAAPYSIELVIFSLICSPAFFAHLIYKKQYAYASVSAIAAAAIQYLIFGSPIFIAFILVSVFDAIVIGNCFSKKESTKTPSVIGVFLINCACVVLYFVFSENTFGQQYSFMSFADNIAGGIQDMIFETSLYIEDKNQAAEMLSTMMPVANTVYIQLPQIIASSVAVCAYLSVTLFGIWQRLVGNSDEINSRQWCLTMSKLSATLFLLLYTVSFFFALSSEPSAVGTALGYVTGVLSLAFFAVGTRVILRFLGARFSGPARFIAYVIFFAVLLFLFGLSSYIVLLIGVWASIGIRVIRINKR